MPELLIQPPLEANAQSFRGVATVPAESVLPQLEQQLVTEASNEPVLPQMPRHRSTESVSLREQWKRTRLGRKIGAAVAAAAVIFGGVVVEAGPAAADSGQEYTITDDASGGVYARNSPHMEDTERISGKGIYPGDIVHLICGIPDGEPMGEKPHNTTWHKIVNESRPSQGEFWENDHFFNTPNKPGELAPNEPNCNNESRNTSEQLQNVETIQPFVSYDRSAVKDWALRHATDTPPNAGSCTWFVSQALTKGNFPQNDTFNVAFQGTPKRWGLRYGTDTAQLTQNFLDYMNTLPYVKIEPLGKLKTGINNIPDARLGDVIIYDWDNRGGVDHADVITGAAGKNPQYPLVSGWSEDGSNAVDYPQRGWTWSAEHNTYLQTEVENGKRIHEEMTAYLVHVRSEDEVNW